MSEKRHIRIHWVVPAAAMIGAFALAGFWSVRTAIADHWLRQRTLTATRKAIRLEPDSAASYAQLAAILQETDPAAAAEALHRAVTLNPRDSQSWIDLGLRAEATGDPLAAEHSLLTAARVDHLYLPRWSLANFYFRAGNLEKFWFWTREAVQMAYGDLTPLFDLCWRVTSDGELIERNLDIRRPHQEANYLSYLTGQNPIEPMARAAARLFQWKRETDVPVLLAATDRFLAADRADAALQVWNHLANLHQIPFAALHPNAGQSVTNGDFRLPVTANGFDWRVPTHSGVSDALLEQPSALRLTFSGRQPESCELLTQFLPVLADSQYEMRFRYQTSGIAPGTGLIWLISDAQGKVNLARSDSLASENEQERQLPFRTSSQNSLVRLALAYQRVLGTTRIEGSITLRKVDVVRRSGLRP